MARSIETWIIAPTTSGEKRKNITIDSRARDIKSRPVDQPRRSRISESRAATSRRSDPDATNVAAGIRNDQIAGCASGVLFVGANHVGAGDMCS